MKQHNNDLVTLVAEGLRHFLHDEAAHGRDSGIEVLGTDEERIVAKVKTAANPEGKIVRARIRPVTPKS